VNRASQAPNVAVEQSEHSILCSLSQSDWCLHTLLLEKQMRCQWTGIAGT